MKEGHAHLNHIAVYVADLKKSGLFYRDVIGAEIIPDPFKDDRHVWLKIGEHNQLHLIKGRHPNPGNLHFAFSVRSLDEFTASLTKRSIPYDDGHGKPNQSRVRPDGVRQIYFQDPDGYWIEVNEDRF